MSRVPWLLGGMCTPFDASAPQKANCVFVTQSSPVTAGGGKRSAAGWNGLICGSAYWCPWAGGAAQQELSAGGAGEDVNDLWFGVFLCLLPQLLDVFPPLTFCFRRVPFLTLKISKPPKAALTVFYVPQQFLKLLPPSVFYLSLCCSLGGTVATPCPWSPATRNHALAAWVTLLAAMQQLVWLAYQQTLSLQKRFATRMTFFPYGAAFPRKTSWWVTSALQQ